jgi:hypothetical protein
MIVHILFLNSETLMIERRKGVVNAVDQDNLSSDGNVHWRENSVLLSSTELPKNQRTLRDVDAGGTAALVALGSNDQVVE